MRIVVLASLAACSNLTAEQKPLDVGSEQVDVRVADSPPIFEQNDLSGDAGSWAFFNIELPPGADILSVQTSGGSGDVDLYVQTHTPSTTDFACRSWNPGNGEVCNIDNPATEYVIGVHAYTPYAGVDLAVRVGKPGDDSPLVINEVLRHDGGFDGNCNGGIGGDEPFIEIVNTTYNPMDLSGMTLSNNDGVVHVFDYVWLRSEESVVVWQSDNNLCATDGAQWVHASTDFLGLWEDRLETVTLAGADGTVLDQVFVNQLEGQSWVRETEADGTAEMMPHPINEDGEGASPGTKEDGGTWSLFPTSVLELGQGRCEPMLEPNDSFEQPHWFFSVYGYPILLWSASDDDWYEVYVSPGETMTAHIEFLHENGDLDVHLVDTDGNPISSSTSTTDSEEVAWTNEGEEAAYVVFNVSRFGGTDTDCQPYTLSLD